MKRDIYDRIKTALVKLNNLRDINFTTIIVKWDKHRRFLVECIRGGENITDADGEVAMVRKGIPLEFEVYYQADGKDKDCCSLQPWLGDEDFKPLAEFVDMYR